MYEGKVGEGEAASDPPPRRERRRSLGAGVGVGVDARAELGRAGMKDGRAVVAAASMRDAAPRRWYRAVKATICTSSRVSRWGRSSAKRPW